jgi:hypothetical protein
MPSDSNIKDALNEIDKTIQLVESSSDNYVRILRAVRKYVATGSGDVTGDLNTAGKSFRERIDKYTKEVYGAVDFKINQGDNKPQAEE